MTRGCTRLVAGSWALAILVSLLTISAATMTPIPAGAAVTRIDRGGTCCSPARRVSPPEAPRRAETAGLIGDSLSVGITDDRYQVGPTIQSKFTADGRRMWIETSSGITMSIGLDVARRRRVSIGDTDVVVVALGTNDIFNSGANSRAAWQRSIEALVDTIQDANPDAVVVWVDVAFPRFSQRATAFNEVLDTEAARLDHLVVCDWAQQVDANPQWYGGDLLHLTSVGYAARREVVIGCIDAVQFPR